MRFIAWFAAILAVWVFVKFLLLTFKYKEFMTWGKSLLTKKNITIFKYVYLIVFLILAYYLLLELTAVQFFAAMLAGMMLFAHTLTHFPKVFKVYLSEFKGKNSMLKIALDWIIWLGIAALVLKELFF